ncbi:hypothetical protein [Oryzihumus leptocrescens]|uniref:hypothetical protein n=1 Tax=Oryzihumus leptocrescens TaxID=297536 RepID=UPI00114DA872|nr:hypothetical protein [Oryzihumus leptocrescens]
MTIKLDGERLVAHGHGRRLEFAADDVRRAVWLSADQARALLGFHADLATRYCGLVVLLGDAGPLLAFFVMPFAPSAGEPTVRLETSGATSLAKRLGLVIEPEEQPAFTGETVKRVLVTERGPGMAAAVASGALAVLGSVAGFLAMPNRDQLAGVLLLMISLVLGGVLAGWLVREQRRFQAAVTSPPEPADHTVYPVGVTGPYASRLLLGARDIVFWHGGCEKRLRGPLSDAGVTTCLIGPDVIRLVDALPRDHLLLDTAQVCPTPEHVDQLRAACEAAGLRVEQTPLPLATGHEPLRWTYDKKHQPGVGMLASEHAAIGFVTPLWTFFALVLTLCGSLGQLGPRPALGVVAVVIAALELAALAWTHLTFRRWRRRVIAASRPEAGR